MIKQIPSENMWKSNLCWLKSNFHFSFAEYYNEKNINFGVLRVVNDDVISPGKGFDEHPHIDIEILSYVIRGKLSHKDSTGKKAVLEKGEVQYMSAGTGISHSEYNNSDEDLRFIQLMILPNVIGKKADYKNFKFKWEERVNKFFHIASEKNGNAPVKVNQDINIFAAEIEKNKNLHFEIKEKRQAYLIQAEGASLINNRYVTKEKDGLQAIGESLDIMALNKSHILIVEMKERMDLK